MKKAQIRIFESIAVLVIFVFFVAIGLRFYTTAQMNELQRVASQFSDLDAVKVALVLSHLPEVSCTLEAITDSTCLDFQKLTALEQLLEERGDVYEHYIPFLGLSTITINQTYPSTPPIFIELYDANISSFSNVGVLGRTRLQIPTSLEDQVLRRKSFAILRVDAYSITR